MRLLFAQRWNFHVSCCFNIEEQNTGNYLHGISKIEMLWHQQLMWPLVPRKMSARGSCKQAHVKQHLPITILPTPEFMQSSRWSHLFSNANHFVVNWSGATLHLWAWMRISLFAWRCSPHVLCCFNTREQTSGDHLTGIELHFCDTSCCCESKLMPTLVPRKKSTRCSHSFVSLFKVPLLADFWQPVWDSCKFWSLSIHSIWSFTCMKLSACVCRLFKSFQLLNSTKLSHPLVSNTKIVSFHWGNGIVVASHAISVKWQNKREDELLNLRMPGHKMSSHQPWAIGNHTAAKCLDILGENMHKRAFVVQLIVGSKLLVFTDSEIVDTTALNTTKSTHSSQHVWFLSNPSRRWMNCRGFLFTKMSKSINTAKHTCWEVLRKQFQSIWHCDLKQMELWMEITLCCLIVANFWQRSFVCCKVPKCQASIFQQKKGCLSFFATKQQHLCFLNVHGICLHQPLCPLFSLLVRQAMEREQSCFTLLCCWFHSAFLLHHQCWQDIEWAVTN